MTSPVPNPYEPLINALESLNEHTREQTGSINSLSAAVLNEAAARDKKVQVIQRLTAIMAAGIVVLLLVAGLNLYNTTQSRKAAAASQSLNATLLSCLQPDTPCSNQNAAQQTSQNNQIRQTVFVLFVCGRQNPVNPNNPDPQGATNALVNCVKTYYPEFKLPSKAGK